MRNDLISEELCKYILIMQNRGPLCLLMSLKIKPQVSPMACKARHDLVTASLFNLTYHHSSLHYSRHRGLWMFLIQIKAAAPSGLCSHCSSWKVLSLDTHITHSLTSFMPLFKCQPVVSVSYDGPSGPFAWCLHSVWSLLECGLDLVMCY